MAFIFGWIRRSCVLATFIAISAQAGAGFQSITVDEFARWRDQGVAVIDIRRNDEWRATGVIAGSALITAYDANGRLKADFVERVARLAGPDIPLALICRSGNRSARAAELLSGQAGYANVLSVDGGMNAWVQRGGPIVPCATC